VVAGPRDSPAMKQIKIVFGLAIILVVIAWLLVFGSIVAPVIR
jgi:heme/copper-type cytochrome/quinol oxidase subunit 4